MRLPSRHRPSPSRRAGAGEPVVLLHPLMLSHHSWRPVVDRLSQGHDVLAPTLPGHWGGPPLPWHRADLDSLVAHVERQMDDAGWATAHLVGNSLGGWLALELARRGRARSVTAIAPGGGHTFFAPRDLLLGLGFAGAATLRRGLRAVNLLPASVPLPPLALVALRTIAPDPAALAPQDVRHLVRASLGASHPLQVILAYARARPARGLEDIDVPVHLVFAEHDVVLPTPTHAPYFTSRLPDAHVTHLTEHGHCPQLSDPDLVVGLVKESIALSGRHLAVAR
ncbi:alpha/beta fold hydrolase [Nocardioides sp. HDW12B]|uniref:alpha/beta fold hydrolase n=1 Tax=Nocardioides sp. HDW12B TaxID=2714939 RepID=UPI00140C8476|nr:alpha/beta fold hydrolase [Nocardioides sp. HDW12B]QIK65250.1 alpha/beta fold hydrolase [Nocardioides sp. HDW12B]